MLYRWTDLFGTRHLEAALTVPRSSEMQKMSNPVGFFSFEGPPRARCRYPLLIACGALLASAYALSVRRGFGRVHGIRT
jgi:hypothetical protein